MNGFGENGGKALINSLRQNNVIKEVDLSANRITDSVVKLVGSSLDELEGLSVLLVLNKPSTFNIFEMVCQNLCCGCL